MVSLPRVVPADAQPADAAPPDATVQPSPRRLGRLPQLELPNARGAVGSWKRPLPAVQNSWTVLAQALRAILYLALVSSELSMTLAVAWWLLRH